MVEAWNHTGHFVHEYYHHCFPSHNAISSAFMFSVSFLYITFHHSAAEHRASTRIFHLTLFLVSILIPTQVFLTLLASSSTVLRRVFLGLPLPCLLWGFHCRACLAMLSDCFHSVWPSHPHVRFLICKSIVGCLVHFHSSSFVIWSVQKILNIFLSFIHIVLKLYLLKSIC
jgi:hypothetical protein